MGISVERRGSRGNTPEGAESSGGMGLEAADQIERLIGKGSSVERPPSPITISCLTWREPNMKMTIEIDCSPVEARAFLGLPDVSALNDHLVQEMQARMDANMAMLAP